MNEIVKKDTNITTITKEKIVEFLDNMGLSNKLSKAQKLQFVEIAHSLQLNPFLREIYAIPFGNNLQIVTGYETYLKRAQRSGVFNGMNCVMEKRQDDLYAICEVFRKDMSHSIKVEVPFKEYNQNNAMWKSKPQTMLRKVAISQALRMAFPEELSGIYTQDELDSNAKEIVAEIPKQANSENSERTHIEVVEAEVVVETPKKKKLPIEKVKSAIKNADTVEKLTDIEIKIGQFEVTQEDLKDLRDLMDKKALELVENKEK